MPSPFVPKPTKFHIHIIDISQQEVQELCCVGVLQNDVYSKMGGKMFIPFKKEWRWAISH
jgi:hypothetical protein